MEWNGMHSFGESSSLRATSTNQWNTRTVDGQFHLAVVAVFVPFCLDGTHYRYGRKAPAGSYGQFRRLAMMS
jgi:hypothetical protein